MVLVGLTIYTIASALLITWHLTTPIWLVVANLLLVGAAFGLTNQISVSAMARIDRDDHQEVANGSTLITVLHATAAPIGVALLASLVEGRSAALREGLLAQGITGRLLEQQTTLLAMHTSFFLAACLGLAALGAMVFVPKR